MPRTALTLVTTPTGERWSGPSTVGRQGGPMHVMVRPTAGLLRLAEVVTLAAHERARAAALPAGSRRDDYLAAHILVRLCVARSARVQLHSVLIRQSCAGCGGDDHGRPYLPEQPGTYVSLSHSDGVVAAAAGRSPVGVEVENAVGRPFHLGVARRVLADTELREVLAADDPARAFLRHWVRREALVKVGAAKLLDRTAPPSPADWHLREHTGPGGWYVAAAVTRAGSQLDHPVTELTD